MFVRIETTTIETGSVSGDFAQAAQDFSQMQANASFGSLSDSQPVEAPSMTGDAPSMTGDASSVHDTLDDFGEFSAEPVAVETTTVAMEQVALDPTAPITEAAPASNAALMEELVVADSAPPVMSSNPGSVQALSEAEFSAPPAPPSHTSTQEPALNAYNSPFLQEFRAAQAQALAEKEEAENREIARINEEAQAELELMESQRAKQIAAAKTANRERQTAEEELFANSSGWEAVCNYAASTEDNFVPDSLTDLSKMKSLLRVLKNTPPVASA